MTTQKAQELVAAFAYLTELTPDFIRQKNIALLMENARRDLLGRYPFKFARGQVTYKIPTLFLHDKHFLVFERYNANFDRYIQELDFFYLKSVAKLEDVLSYYEMLIAYPKDGGTHALRTSSVDVTELKPYFQFFLKSIKYPEYIERPDDVLFIIGEEAYRTYDIDTVLRNVDYKQYKERILFIYNVEYRSFYDHIIKTQDVARQTELRNAYALTKHNNDLSYHIKTATEATLDKEIELLPDTFTTVVCKFVARDILLGGGDLDKANVMYADAERSFSRLVELHTAEVSNSDHKEITDYKAKQKHDGAW